MKQVFSRIIFAFMVMVGLFISVVKGQEARTKWMNKIKSRSENKPQVRPDEILLDDFEWQSFHDN